MEKEIKLSNKEWEIAHKISRIFGCGSCEPEVCPNCAEIERLMIKRHKRKIQEKSANKT